MNTLPLREYISMANTANKPLNANNSIQVATIETAVGVMFAASTDRGICMLEFPSYSGLLRELRQIRQTLGAPLVEGHSAYLASLQDQITQYFSGKRKTFDIPLDCIGTDFQKIVWHALLKIPYGTTTTYRELAAEIGKPSAIRAVANANGHNKIAILIPCHRVIGADGSLTGYAGGLDRKKKLLAVEHRYLP